MAISNPHISGHGSGFNTKNPEPRLGPGFLIKLIYIYKQKSKPKSPNAQIPNSLSKPNWKSISSNCNAVAHASNTSTQQQPPPTVTRRPSASSLLVCWLDLACGFARLLHLQCGCDSEAFVQPSPVPSAPPSPTLHRHFFNHHVACWYLGEKNEWKN